MANGQNPENVRLYLIEHKLGEKRAYATDENNNVLNTDEVIYRITSLKNDENQFPLGTEVLFGKQDQHKAIMDARKGIVRKVKTIPYSQYEEVQQNWERDSEEHKFKENEAYSRHGARQREIERTLRTELEAIKKVIPLEQRLTNFF